MKTKNLETFVPKINNNFPDVARFFEGEKELSYQVNVKDLIESLGVMAMANNEDICLEFTEKQLKISTINDGSYIEDFIDAVRTVGTEDKKLWVSTSLFTDIIKAMSKEEKINFDFKSAIPAMGYSIEKKDNMDIYGILAPKRK
jgi:DNA polymerase III sliding clamp (beta) subunit (PCNA family)